jgi:acyl-coenzyme A thioesterase PaaI-like protein
MTFADMLMPFAALMQTDLGDHFLPTVSLSADFLAPARLGAWVEGRARVLRTTRNLVFVEALVTAEGAAILRTNGIFKIGPPLPRAAKPDL